MSETMTTETTDQPDLNSLEETKDGLDWDGSREPTERNPVPEALPEPHVMTQEPSLEEDPVRVLSAAAAALYVSPEPLLGGARVPRSGSCWSNPSNPLIHCYVVAGSKASEGEFPVVVVLCDYFELNGLKDRVIVTEITLHISHFVTGNLVPFNGRPRWTEQVAKRVPNPLHSETQKQPEQEPAGAAVGIEQTIGNLASELGQSRSHVERLVDGALQGILGFVQTKGVIETSPVLGAFVEQIKSSPIIETFRELLGMKGSQGQIGNDANVQQVVDYINEALEPRLDEAMNRLVKLESLLSKLDDPGEYRDDEPLSPQGEVDDEEEDLDADEPEEDVDIDEPEVAPKPARSSRPPKPATKGRPGRPVGAADKRPRRISTKGRKPARKPGRKPSVAPPSALGPSGRQKVAARRTQSIAAKQKAKLQPSGAVLDKFMAGAENVKVRRLLRGLPDAKLLKFIAGASKGAPSFDGIHWTVQQQADFYGWFARTKHASRR